MTDKVLGLALSVAALAPGFFNNELTTPIMGASVTTVAGAVLGTYAAIGYEETRRPRGRLFSLAISTVILASMASGVVPAWLGWTWTNTAGEGAVAGLTAFVFFHLLTPVLKRTGEMVRGFKLSDLLPWRRGAPEPRARRPRPPLDLPPDDENPDR